MPENEFFLEETVFPSNEKTIKPDLQGLSAHVYRIRRCMGFVNGKTKYTPKDKPVGHFTILRFVEKNERGGVTPGLQNEQLIIVLKDRIKKLDAKFPHSENQNMLKALDDFLEASKRRVQERMDRGVMGELKK